MKGQELEKKISQDFHHSGIPLLISPALLRSRDLGQVDLARLGKDRQGWMLELGEVKSSMVGVEQMQRRQKGRLFATQRFLSAVFGHRSRLIPLLNDPIVLVGIAFSFAKIPDFH